MSSEKTQANTVDTNNRHEYEEEDEQGYSVFGAVTAYTVFIILILLFSKRRLNIKKMSYNAPKLTPHSCRLSSNSITNQLIKHLTEC